MEPDDRLLGAAFVLLAAMLGLLLLFAWAHNRKVHALAWWGAAYFLFASGIGLGHPGQTAPGYLTLLLSNALVALGYGVLYAGCRTFNGRSTTFPAVILGAVVWVVTFLAIAEMPRVRLLLLSLIAAGYAARSAWELGQHGSQRLVSQRTAVVLLLGLAAFNVLRGLLGLWPGPIPWIEAFTIRWSGEIALVLVVYAPTLAFMFLSMAKERIEADHRQSERALRESEEHYRHSVELNPEIPWTADPQGNIIAVSSRLYEVTGLPVEEGLGRGWIKALHPDDVAPTLQCWLRSVSTGEPLDVEYRVRLIDQSCHWFRARAAARFKQDGTVVRWYGTLEDIHDRKVAEERLRWAAYHDDLTGLPNRRLFQERLQQALDQASRTGCRAGLLILDLDDFKQVNDRFGHDAGDELLKAFSKRLVHLVRTSDTVARLGGDEFAVVLCDLAAEADVIRIAGALQARIQEPLRLTHSVRECSTSIGGAVSAECDVTADELLKQADLALYSAKVAGRGTFMMFQPTMREEAQKLASALEVARTAVAHDWIAPHYQPKVTLSSGALAGFEALLRWRHPRLGIQSPEALASAFDDAELGIALGERMLSRVFRDMRRWLDAGLDFGRIAVNASAAEFRREGYAERVLDLLRQAGVPPSRIEVEVTESVLLDHNAVRIERALRTLRSAGVTIALDDFGTGYASLAHLKRFPVNEIKIDRSFVRGMERDADDATIVKAVLSLSHNLGIEVVAEGIETLAQASMLWEQDCEVGQGYFFGHPMDGEDVPQLIRSWSCEPTWRIGRHAAWSVRSPQDT